MEKTKKCKSKKHEEINAISYCKECNVYMCNKCSNFHSELFENHHNYDLGKEKEDIFTGLCKENDHSIELIFFCKTHNQLCCVGCISKIKGNGYGQHTDCEVCFIDKIKDEKKNNLKDNLKYLENISFNFEKTMKELKEILEKINENKENLKIEISKNFTKLRNSLNEREDELLMDIDKKFNDCFVNEKMLKQNEKLPYEIKYSLERGKELDKEWDNDINKLNLYINDCITIENSIKKLKLIEKNIKNINSVDIKIKFMPEDKTEINKFVDGIRKFGSILVEREGTNKIYISDLDSVIINNNTEYNKILKSWINPDKNIRAELLYRLTRDGEKISKFHELCDNKGPTLTLFHTEDESKGGIFTPLSWDTVSGKKSDMCTFMFNLNKSTKYKQIKNYTSIWCTKDFGPWTISFGFVNSMKRIEHRGLKISDIYEKGAEILSNDSNNTKYFNVKEIEIYQILYQ